ncbi:MAG: hypothetical protein IID61_01010 [SAR324 cluster bacterium]|nr:hypothetical protein [SAR324 cluster bacterium]
MVLDLPHYSITAFSISALATYVLVPKLNSVFDLGECILEAVPLDHVFISHAHGDHARCMLRHESLRRLFGMKPATYYIPEQTLDGFNELARAWKTLEQVPPRNFEYPNFQPMKAGDVVWLHRQLAAKSFRANHTLPSLGYTLYDVRKKLKPEFQGREGRELAALRREGVVFENEVWLPLITYIGDSTIETLYREQHVGESETLFMEITFLMDDEREIARQRGHTHLDDLLQFLHDCPDVLQNEHIVLKHFSMRYDRRFIVQTLKSKLPSDFLERVHILV